MNRDYALINEEKDYLLMREFNENVLKLRDLGKTELMHHSDATGYTTDGRFINIELKSRNVTLQPNCTISGTSNTSKKGYTADTIFIESHKMADLLLDYVYEKKVPLYVNFINNKTVILYNLSALKHKPKTTALKLWNELHTGFEMAKRLELPITDAYIYIKEDNNWKLTHRPS